MTHIVRNTDHYVVEHGGNIHRNVSREQVREIVSPYLSAEAIDNAIGVADELDDATETDIRYVPGPRPWRVDGKPANREFALHCLTDTGLSVTSANRMLHLLRLTCLAQMENAATRSKMAAAFMDGFREGVGR